MQKDLKIGMVIGMLLVLASAIWLSTRQSLSVKSRMLRSRLRDFSEENRSAKQTLVPYMPNESETKLDIQQPIAENKPENTLIRSKNDTFAKRIHIVRKGETLSQISAEYFGSADNWKKILDANKKIIKNPNKLTPGTKLVIPD
jgi:nucleoid-associated protein YgaU